MRGKNNLMAVQSVKRYTVRWNIMIAARCFVFVAWQRYSYIINTMF